MLLKRRTGFILRIAGELDPALGCNTPRLPCNSYFGHIRRIGFTLLCSVLSLSLCSCRSANHLPQKSSKEYAEAVSAFYIGLAALQVGDDVHAESKLSEVTTVVPGEPAGWANWGVLALRQRNLDGAAQRFERASKLAPRNDRIYQLRGLLESARGNSAKAIADWRKAVEIDPSNYRAAYELAQEVERQSEANSDAEYQQLIQTILVAQPDNLAAQLELARIAAKRGDTATLHSVLLQIAPRSSSWPVEVKTQLTALQTAANAPDLHAAATRTTFLRNTLMRVPEFRESLAVLQAPAGEEAEPFSHFLRLPQPDFLPAPSDAALAFTPQPVPGANGDDARW